jgi:hypothetical protein
MVVMDLVTSGLCKGPSFPPVSHHAPDTSQPNFVHSLGIYHAHMCDVACSDVKDWSGHGTTG